MSLLVSSSFLVSDLTLFRLTSRRVCQNIKLIAALCHDRELIICSLFSMQRPVEDGTYRVAEGWVCFASGFSGRARSSWRSTPLYKNHLPGVMNSSTKLLPMTSRELKPVISEALTFHTFTFPSESTPKMGALGIRGVCVSNRRDVLVALRASAFSPTNATPTVCRLD